MDKETIMAEETFTYTPTCHIVVAVSNEPCGPSPNHYWPDTEANREAGLATRLTMTEAEAAHYGTDLRKLGPATEGNGATEGTEATETK